MEPRDDRFDGFEELLADKPRDETWELIGGRAVEMTTGAPYEHDVIVQNIDVAPSSHLRARGSPCRDFTEAFRREEQSLDTSVLPDVMGHGGPLPPGASSLDRPAVLVEVSSDGSIERDKPVLEGFDRAGEARFGERLIEGLDAVLELSALDLAIPLAEIYRDVLSA